LEEFGIQDMKAVAQDRQVEANLYCGNGPQWPLKTGDNDDEIFICN